MASWQAVLLLAAAVAALALGAWVFQVLIEASPLKRQPLMGGLLNFLGPPFVLWLATWLLVASQSAPKEDFDLRAILEDRALARLRSSFHTTSWVRALLDQISYGVALFVDRLDRADPLSRALIERVCALPGESGLRLAVVTCDATRADLLGRLQTMTQVNVRVLDATLFTPAQLQTIAQEQGREAPASGAFLAGMTVAEVVRGVTRREHESIEGWLALKHNDDTAFDDLAVVYYLYFCPLDGHQLPKSYPRMLFRETLPRELAGLDRYGGKDLQFPREIPSSVWHPSVDPWCVRPNPKERTEFLRNPRLEGFLRAYNDGTPGVFAGGSLARLPHVHLFWALHEENRGKELTLDRASRLIRLLTCADTDTLELGPEHRQALRARVVAGLLNAASYLVDRCLRVDRAIAAGADLIERWNVQGPERVATAVMTARAFFVTLDPKSADLLRQLRDAGALTDAGTEAPRLTALLAFHDAVKKGPRAIAPAAQSDPPDPIGVVVELLRRAPEIALRMVATHHRLPPVDLPKLADGSITLEALATRCLLADARLDLSDQQAYLDEVESLLVAMSLFQDSPTRVGGGLLRQYVDGKLLVHGYCALTLLRPPRRTDDASPAGAPAPEADRTSRRRKLILDGLAEVGGHRFAGEAQILEELTGGAGQGEGRLGRLESLAYHLGASSILADLYASHARVLTLEAEDPRRLARSRELLRQAVQVEERRGVCFLRPRLLVRWITILDDASLRPSLLESLYGCSREFDFPPEIRRALLKRVLGEFLVHRLDVAAAEHMLALFDQDYADFLPGGDVSVVEMLDDRLHFKIQALKLLDPVRARSELHVLMGDVAALPPSADTESLRLAARIIECDVCETGAQQKLMPTGGADTIARELWADLRPVLTGSPAASVPPERGQALWQEAHEIVKRSARVMDAADLAMLLSLYVRFVEEKEKREQPVPASFLDAAIEVAFSSITRDHEGPEVIATLRGLVELARRGSDVDREFRTLHELIKLRRRHRAPGDAAALRNAEERAQELAAIGRRRLVDIKDDALRFSELERLASHLPDPETVPPDVEDRFRQARRLLYGSKVDECIEMLGAWRRGLDVNRVPLFREIEMLELLAKAHRTRVAATHGDEGMLHQIERDAALFRIQKEVRELERLIAVEKDPEVQEALRALKREREQGEGMASHIGRRR
jgi:hypothetical protein